MITLGTILPLTYTGCGQSATAAPGVAANGKRRDPFAVDEGRALTELELVWGNGGYHGFSADGGTWCAITSTGEVLMGTRRTR